MWIVVFLSIGLLMTQPEFPSATNQAPIGVLAAAGGALALKKLWEKKKGN